ncbi:MAG TPA: immunoglobulin-like domain-containing protein, partial [Tissierellaceae bacterium]|nr:immunoglobulin-like domain-containing protein [Tissierellaceae bacterium]
VYKDMFIEGWVTLKDTKDEHPILNVPYVGFYGDWNQPRIVDAMMGEEDSYYDFSGMADSEGYFYEGEIAFSPGTEDGLYYGVDTITPVPSFLRNAEKVEYNILDRNENKIKTIKTENFVRKNYIDGGRYYPYSFTRTRQWDGTVRDKVVEDGLYNFEIRSKVQNGDWQSKLIPILVDTVRPEVTDIAYDSETGILTWTTTDDSSGTMLIFVDINGRAVDMIEPEEDETEFEINIKDIMDELLEVEGDNIIEITALDNAYNEGYGSLTISNDTQIPYIYLLTPDLLEVYDEDTIDVDGYVLKNNEIISVTVNGEEAEVEFSNSISHTNAEGVKETVSGYTFTHELTDLEDGVNTAIVEAKSLAGTTASIARRFYVDTTPPEFVEVNVLDRDQDSATVDLEITMKDNFPVLNLYVYGSHEFSFDGSDTAFDIEPVEETVTVTVDLDLGENNIPLKLVDAAGNETTQNIEVTRGAMDSERAVELDKTALEIKYRGNDTASSVTRDLLLVDMGQNGSLITWQSSHENIISNRGKVTTPAFDTVVTLTATITSGEESDTKVFTVTVIGDPEPIVGTIYVGYDKIPGGTGESGEEITQEEVEEHYVAYVLFNLKEIFKEYDLEVKLNGKVLEEKVPVDDYDYRFEGSVLGVPSELIININGVDFNVTELV